MSQLGALRRLPSMRIAVAGGTGTLGTPLVAELTERGHDVRVLSRRSAKFPVDLTTGEGLSAALSAVEVVVNASNGPSSGKAGAVLVEGSRRLIEAAAAAGVTHCVTASIVGIHEVPLAYYGVKVAQEAAVRDGAVPWTIVRATQFHELLGFLFAATARFRIRVSSRAQLQPIAVNDAARAFADVAEGPPSRGLVQVAGPEVRQLPDLAREWQLARGTRAVPLRLPLPGKLGRALRRGALTARSPEVAGTTTFSTWLTQTPS